jgi:hypothetical protein
MDAIQQLETLRQIQTQLSSADVCRESHQELMIACVHIYNAIKFENCRLKRMDAVKTLFLVDTATIAKDDIKDWLAHGNGFIEFILMNGQNFFLEGQSAIAFCEQMELIQ